jgi:hypothetical protein
VTRGCVTGFSVQSEPRGVACTRSLIRLADRGRVLVRAHEESSYSPRRMTSSGDAKHRELSGLCGAWGSGRSQAPLAVRDKSS